MIVMEDALPDNLFQYLKSHILNENFPWFYTKITGNADTGDDTYVYSFYHRFYDDSCGVLNNTLKPIMDCCIFSILERANKHLEHKLIIKDLYRSRTNLETIKPMNHEHTPHIDDERKHYAAVLYMNDSDGDTIFYHQKYNKSNNRGWLEDIEYIKSNGGFSIDKTLTPKENKVVIFDGSIYHSSFAPINSHTRCVVNFTFSTIDNDGIGLA